MSKSLDNTIDLADDPDTIRAKTRSFLTDPQKIRPPDPPPAGEGVQLYSPPWTIPAHGEAEVCFASHYDFSSQVPEALRDFQAVLATNPRHVIARYNLARALNAQGQKSAAVAELRKVLEIDPGHEPSRRALQALTKP